MLIVDSTSNYDESYSIFNFVWEIICYMWEQTLETNSVKLGNGVIIGPLWVKYGGKIACQPPLLKILATPLHLDAQSVSRAIGE